MRKNLITALIVFLLVGGLSAHHTHNHDFNFDSIGCNGRNYEFKADCIYITDEDYCDEYIKITSDSKLYVNGHLVKTNYFDRKILDKYYTGLREIREMAIDLGYDGARLGLKGAAIGIKAVAKLPLILFGNVDEYEESVEAEAESIEEEADLLEKRGEEIEKLAEELEECKEDLEGRIKELDQLAWF